MKTSAFFPINDFDRGILIQVRLLVGHHEFHDIRKFEILFEYFLLFWFVAETATTSSRKEPLQVPHGSTHHDIMFAYPGDFE